MSTETEAMIDLHDEIQLPIKPEAPTKTVPSSLILFGLPKVGKTTALSQLPNCLNIDLERGSNFVTTLRLQPPKGLGPVGVYNWFKKVVKKIKDEGNPYDFVAIETISYLDEIAEWVGTYNYCRTPQGKSFNREKDKNGIPIRGGEILAPDDDEYESVHTLPDGNGYRYSRKVMMDILNMCKDLGKICTIFVAHVVDKFIISKQTNTEVRALDLSLTGKVKTIYAKEVDAVGYTFNKNGKLHISFKGSEDKLGGMRGADHMQGYEGELDWNMIFKLK